MILIEKKICDIFDYFALKGINKNEYVFREKDNLKEKYSFCQSKAKPNPRDVPTNHRGQY